MKARRFFAFVAAVGMLFAGGGCTPDNNGPAADEELAAIAVNPESFALDLEGGEQTVSVTSNGAWAATCLESDVVVSPATGSGNGTVTITVPAASTRNFVVTFTASKQTLVAGTDMVTTTTASAEVAVSQNAGGVNMGDFLYYEKCGDDVEKDGNYWPYVDQFAGWSKEGEAAANVVYSGKNASVRASGVNYQPTEDAVGVTGQPYAFLNKVPAEAYFVIENIAVTGGSNYIFTYNVSCQNGYSGTPTFATVDNSLVHLELGYDGESWDAVDCTFAANGGNGWYAATAEFKVAADATKLYARFTYEAPASNGGGRFDDFKLVTGGNGAELAPEVATATEATIAEIAVAGDYIVKNAWAVATYAYGCLLTDASGAYILAYNPTETPAVGEVVNIEGAVSEYGSFLQFGAGSVVTKTGETKTVTHPTAEVMDGAALDSWLETPVIKYVEYTGTLAISSGKYYNVTVAGAATAQGSIQYPDDTLKATLTELDGKNIKVTGYLIGKSSSKYTSTMAVSVEEVAGTTPEPEPPVVDGYNFMSDAALALTASNDTRGYTCSTKVNGSVEANGNGFKLGTGSYAGTFTSGELGVTGDATLEFYACAWNGKTAKLYIRIEGATENLAVIDLAGNTGAANNEPYSITFADSEYHTVALTGLTATTKLQFSTDPAYGTASDKSTGRALVVGAHIK